MAGVDGARPLPADDAFASGDRVNWHQVRLILGARWRILLRGATKSWWRLALTGLGWLVFAGVLVGLTVGAALLTAYARADADLAPYAAAGVHVAFLACLVSLAVTPALGLRGNEFLDVTKLFTLPVGHRTVFAASLAGLLLTPGALLFAMPLAGVVVGWGGGPLEIAGGLLAVAGLTLCGVAIGQVALLLFLDVFRSRKWRDASRIIVVLFSAGIYSGMRFVSSGMLANGAGAVLRSAEGWKDWLMPLPSWWAAHAVTGESPVRWIPALALPLLVAWLVVMAARLQERAYFGEIEERSDVSSGPSRGIAAWLGRRIRGPLGGLVEKDARLLLRDPAIRIMLIQQMGYSLVPLAMAILNAGGRRGGGKLAAAAGSGGFEWILAGVVFIPVVVSTSLAFNPLGTEGPGLQHVLLGPVPRRTIVLSKIIALVVLVGGVLAALCGAGTFVVAMVAGHLPVGAALGRAGLAAIEAPCAYAVFAAVGAVFGSYFPLRVGSRDRRALTQASGAGGGCLRAMAGGATVLAAGALCVPVALCFHHPALARLADVDSVPWFALTVPLGAAYAVCAVWAGSSLGGSALAAREEAALESLTKSYE